MLNTKTLSPIAVQQFGTNLMTKSKTWTLNNSKTA